MEIRELLDRTKAVPDQAGTRPLGSEDRPWQESHAERHLSHDKPYVNVDAMPGADPTDRTTRAEAVQAAIDHAVNTLIPNGLHPTVFVPNEYGPAVDGYAAATVTFDDRVRMVREGQTAAVDVKAFGAAGTGPNGTDDVDAINEAASWADSNNYDRVFHPPGTYTVSSDPTFPGDTGPVGENASYDGSSTPIPNELNLWGFGPDDPVRGLHVQIRDVGLTATELGEATETIEYPLLLESEDAVIALASHSEGDHGSGIDLLEFDNADDSFTEKWTIVKTNSDAQNDSSSLKFHYGTDPYYPNNKSVFDLDPDSGAVFDPGSFNSDRSWQDGFSWLAIVDPDPRIRAVGSDGGSWGAFFTLDQTDDDNAFGSYFENTWGIGRQTDGDGGGDGRLAFTYGTNTDPALNSELLSVLSDGKVGINETSPQRPLQVSVDAGSEALIRLQGAGDEDKNVEWWETGGDRHWHLAMRSSTDSHAMQFWFNDGTIWMRQASLATSGALSIRTPNSGTGTGLVVGGSDLNEIQRDSSTRRDKDEIEVLEDVEAADVLAIDAVSYERHGQREVGFIAEDFDFGSLSHGLAHDESGRVEGFLAGSRAIDAAQQVVLRNHERRLQELEDEARGR